MEKIHARVLVKIILDFWFMGKDTFTREDVDSIFEQLIKQTEEAK